ncbi:MAG: hypothetical protein RL095_3209 [Verrucomicrobiota bacterium]|jgi:DNA polymerase V
MIPMASADIQAGFPSPAEDFLDRPLDLEAWLNPQPASSFLLRVRGESMLRAGILPGDLILVDRGLEAQERDIVVAVLEGGFTVKRFRRDRAGRPWLLAEGSVPLPPFPLDDHSLIWGVVRAVARKTR